MCRILWIVQSVLAIAFLGAGAMKLVTPLDIMSAYLPLPGVIIRTIGLAEILGAVGLILPALLHIRPQLTPLAARCLTALMCGAVVLTPTVLGFDASNAILPLALGILAAFVAYGRSRLAPIAPTARRRPPAAAASSRLSALSPNT